MAKKSSRKNQPQGIFRELSLQVQLVFRLMADSRVNAIIKIIPFASLAYFLIPDILIGPIDDTAVILLGLYLFIELCPPNVVVEHRQKLWGTLSGSQKESPQQEVIDVEFRAIEDDPTPGGYKPADDDET